MRRWLLAVSSRGGGEANLEPWGTVDHLPHLLLLFVQPSLLQPKRSFRDRVMESSLDHFVFTF